MQGELTDFSSQGSHCDFYVKARGYVRHWDEGAEGPEEELRWMCACYVQGGRFPPTKAETGKEIGTQYQFPSFHDLS